MSRMRIHVRVFPDFKSVVYLPWLRRVANQTLVISKLHPHASVGIVIADGATLRDLNYRFRGLDEETDVLSFGNHQETLEGGVSNDTDSIFPANPEGDDLLGEVIISYPQAARQAEEHEWSIEREVALLVTHGLLHLLGYDHVEISEEALMKALECEILAPFFPGEIMKARR